MEHILLSVKLGDVPKGGIRMGIISKSDPAPVLVAAWQSGAIILSLNEVKSWL